MINRKICSHTDRVQSLYLLAVLCTSLPRHTTFPNRAYPIQGLPGMDLQCLSNRYSGSFYNRNGAAYSVYTKNANRWVIGGEYLHKKYDYKDMEILVEQFTAEGSYYLKFLSDRRKSFFLSLVLSALAGHETSNRNEKLLPDGSTLLDKECFIYGGALTLEQETYLTDRGLCS